MTTEEQTAMADRWEADLAKLTVNSLARESLSQAIKDLREDTADERKAG